MSQFKRYKEQADRLKEAIHYYPEYFKQDTRVGLHGTVEEIAEVFGVNIRTVQRMRTLYNYMRENNLKLTTMNIIEAIDELNDQRTR